MLARHTLARRPGQAAARSPTGHGSPRPRTLDPGQRCSPRWTPHVGRPRRRSNPCRPRAPHGAIETRTRTVRIAVWSLSQRLAGFVGRGLARLPPAASGPLPHAVYTCRCRRCRGGCGSGQRGERRDAATSDWLSARLTHRLPRSRCCHQRRRRRTGCGPDRRLPSLPLHLMRCPRWRRPPCQHLPRRPRPVAPCRRWPRHPMRGPLRPNQRGIEGQEARGPHVGSATGFPRSHPALSGVQNLPRRPGAVRLGCWRSGRPCWTCAERSWRGPAARCESRSSTGEPGRLTTGPRRPGAEKPRRWRAGMRRRCCVARRFRGSMIRVVPGGGGGGRCRWWWLSWVW